MQMEAFRRAEKMTQAQFAQRCMDISQAVIGRNLRITQQHIARLEAGLRPSKDIAAVIYAATGGEVAPNDFYPLPDLDKIESSAVVESRP
jgi:transcriptional regulator with XRE-family HTH domain